MGLPGARISISSAVQFISLSTKKHLCKMWFFAVAGLAGVPPGSSPSQKKKVVAFPLIRHSGRCVDH